MSAAGRDAVVWVTGASSGIGRAVARRYADGGWTVAASARNAAALEDLAGETARSAGRLVPMPLDTTDGAAVAAVVAAIEQTLGPISLAILNAGVHQPVSLEAFQADVFRRLFEVNVLGTVHCLQALLPRLIGRRGGEVAIVASVAGYRGLRTAAAYGATKAALINLAEALKVDLDSHQVRLRLINPGFVRTPATDRNDFAMPFLVDAEVAAERIWRGLQGDAFEITFPRRFTWMLKLMRILPYAVYFPVVGRITRPQ